MDENEYDDEKLHIGKAIPSWLTSLIVHIILLLVLALCTMELASQQYKHIIAAPQDELYDIEEFLPDPIDFVPPEKIDVTLLDTHMYEYPEDVTTALNPDDKLPGDPNLTIGQPIADIGDIGDRIGDGGGDGGTGLIGRFDRFTREKGTKEGQAVAAALKWLSAHQNSDGSWSFDHAQGICQGRCRNTGKLGEARLGSTGMGILPFLGAGQTHIEGEYKQNVGMALQYLLRNMKQTGALNESGGRMYSHGIATIALCEAYGMTQDKMLLAPAQAAINFTVHAQDPTGGGWRYEPRQAGDTSVVGWQVVALKSGHLAYLIVPPKTVEGANKFLDFVEYDSGLRYGYTNNQRGSKATTAIGHLCRMMLGRNKDHPALERGVQMISQQGPSQGDWYYNYYATQVMRHWQGPLWKEWNQKMWAQLLNSQAQEGHEKGSWYTKGDHGSGSGGRLYCTSMGTMILEAHYRHLPIYQVKAVEEEFPL